MSAVDIKEATAYELKPGHKYLLVFDRKSITMNDIAHIQDGLQKFDCEAIAVALGNGVADMKLVDLTASEEVKA